MEVYRIHPETAVYYLTYSVVEWLPVFVTDKAFLTIDSFARWLIFANSPADS